MYRRTFLKDAAASASAGAALAFSRTLSAGKAPPSERIRVGFVGVGGRAGNLVQQFSSQRDVQVVAIADIDQRRIPGAIKAITSRGHAEPSVHGDFRPLVDNPDIDVLVVGTPDHWHAIPTIHACLAGKDVYVEKPDGHNILEGQRMVQAMRKHKRIVQLGTQIRSSDYMQEAEAFIRSGKLGRVLVAKAWESSRQGAIGYPADGVPPDGVDYDTWLGPAPKRPFNPRRFHGSWRWFFDYGTGDVGNDGVHRLDMARRALEAAVEAEGHPALGNPTRVSALGGKWYFDDIQEWPDTLQITFQYPQQGKSPGRLLTYEMRVWTPYRYSQESEGAMLYGDQGYLIIGNSRWRAFAPDGERIAGGSGSYGDERHVRNFLDCVKSRQRPNADLETVGHPSSLLCHAANVAWRVGRQVELDPQTEEFVGDPEANALRTRPEYRKPWVLPEV